MFHAVSFIFVNMQEHLLVALRAAIAAGEAILKIYETESFGVRIKEDGSPLTVADEASNSIINAALSKFDIPVISEENQQIGFKRRKEWETCWIVDPLDGTKEFIKRNGEFTVNIALCHAGKPVFGVIYVPVSKALYYATVESGEAYKTTVQGELRSEDMGKAKDRIQPAPTDFSRIRVVGSRSHMNLETQQFIRKLRTTFEEVEIVKKGSSLKFCLMAEGKADIYPRFAPTMEWDTAAGQALCNAVGLVVLESHTKRSLLYNKKNLFNPSFIVQRP